MKQLLRLGILAILTFNHCLGQQQLALFNEKDSIFISGKIIDFEPEEGNNFISFSTADVDGTEKKQSFQISPDGSFKVALFQHFSGDITMIYKTAFTSLFTKSGSHLQIQIKNSAITAGKQGSEVFLAKGELADINNLIFLFDNEIRDHDFLQEADMGSKDQNDSTFAVRSHKKLGEELAFLDNFITRRNIKNQQFAAWQKNQLIYLAGKDILLFPFLGKLNTTISDKQLPGLLRAIPINNSRALYNSAYYNFLNMLVVDHQIIVNINPYYASVKEKNGNNTIPVNLAQIDKLAKGITREIMYYDLYASHAKTKSGKNSVALISGKFESALTEPVLKKMFSVLNNSLENDFTPYNIISRIEQLKTSNALKTRLLNVFNEMAGNNIFIDFWGDWCGPCMMEMPAYSQLIASFENKPLKFIFFSVKTAQKSADQVKEKYHINADFINLTNDEVAIMNDVFEFHSYPAHFVVNSQGYVVGTNTKKAAEIERLLSKLPSKP